MLNRSILWVDAQGNTSITLLRTAAGAAGIEAQILAVSNADDQQHWEGAPVVNAAPAPVFASYAPLRLRALLLFVCADGTIAQVLVPSPQASLFLADGRTVDPTAAAPLIAACVGSLVSFSGSLATAYQGGHLQGRESA